jgi:hypothetical protein
MPNGDFSSEPGTEWWNSEAPTTSNWTTASAISGHSLVNSIRISGSVQFSLSALQDASSVNEHSYTWIAHVSSTGFLFQLATFKHNIITANSISPTLFELSSPVRTWRDSLSSVQGGQNLALALGGYPPSDIVIDDIQVYRSDINNSLRLRLKPKDTYPRLRNGTYEFTLWVKRPPNRRYYSDLNEGYEYTPKTITLRMEPTGSSGTYFPFPIDGTPYTNAPGGVTGIADAGAGWVKLVLRHERNGTFMINEYSDIPELEISITPYDSARPSPGAIDIAQPELHFYYNNY